MSSKRQTKQKKSSLPLLIIVAALAATVVAGAYLVSRNRSADSSSQVTPAQSGGGSGRNDAEALAKAYPGAQPPRTKGAANAPVVLEEFGDYECAACGRVFQYLKKIEAERGDRLLLIFRHNPLEMHRFGSLAARAAEAAGLQGKFWEMHDLLYEHQEEWSKKEVADPRPLYANYAQSIGLDVTRFANDMNSNAVSTRIVNDMRRARSLGINATPTLYLNSRLLSAPETMEEDLLRAQIEAAFAATEK